jgi:hypothetical protein
MTTPSSTATAKPWFKAKTFGWGWGLALTWQGWLAYALYAAGLLAAALRYPPARDAGAFMLAVAGATAVLLVVCLLKGEMPGQRNGGG